MLHYETIEPGTLDLLKNIQSKPEFAGLRLVGGTALALQLGHRKSVDLDFFGVISLDSTAIAEILSEFGKVTILQDSTNIHIFVVNGVKVDFVNFEFPWRQEPLIDAGIRIAQMEDIAAMKVTAVIGRGTKKDFIDIANLLEIYTIEQILDYYQSKYPNASKFMAIKSLLYFEDAESDLMPVMMKPQTWEENKSKVIEAVNSLH